MAKKNAVKKLPKELTQLVNAVVSLLGETIRREMTAKGFRVVEGVRKSVKSIPSGKSIGPLNALAKKLEKLDKAEQYQVAHAFGLMLELINCCESAYRSFRLKKSPSEIVSRPNKVVFVLTAHPTEARSEEMLSVLSDIRQRLIQCLEAGSVEGRREELVHLLALAWKLNLAKGRKPTVADEARMIYSSLMRRENLEMLSALERQGVDVFVRTWVGGDKDGHPGVDEKAMMDSLSISRHRILQLVFLALEEVGSDVQLLAEAMKESDEYNGLCLLLAEAHSEARRLQRLREGDGQNVKSFVDALERFCPLYLQTVGAESSALRLLQFLVRMFPGLVVPLELREDAGLVHEALSAKERPAIARMLHRLKEVAAGGEIRSYARGMILSMTETAEDIEAGIELVRRTTGGMKLPVVPLFETESALLNARRILRELLSKGDTGEMRRRWSSRFEIMLGYSDSAKQSGSLASRFLISRCMRELERELKAHQFRPVFFHGSGGSVARGGGSVREQTSWWPASAVKSFKATIQGEMIQRTFSTPEILRGQVEKIAEQSRGKKAPSLSREQKKVFEKFVLVVKDSYQSMLARPEFLRTVQEGTPYNYLEHLKIGSRPSKRKGELSLKSLRAIPWVLCWTQTRVLFPVWWGVGGAWNAASVAEKRLLRQCFAKDPLFASFVKLLGFSLAKVDLRVWEFYLSRTDLDSRDTKKLMADVWREFEAARTFVFGVSGKKSLIWERPWLEESIRLRSPLIHPLNVLQNIAFANNDVELLAETITGIACGMLTTG